MARAKIAFLLISLSIYSSLVCAQRQPRALLTQDKAIVCEYEAKTDVFTTGDSFYACTVQTELKNSLFKVTAVNSNPDVTKTDADVTLLIIEENVDFFPANLQIIFPNLQGIKITGQFFKLLTKNDLKDFSNLKYFSIASQIDILGANLFSANTLLEFIKVESFLMSFVHETAFSGLTNLASLKVDTLLCVLDASDAATVATEISKIKTLCQNSEALTQRFETVTLDKAEAATKSIECETSLETKDRRINDLKAFETANTDLNNQITAKNLEISTLTTNLGTCQNDKQAIQNLYDACQAARFPPTGNCLFKDTDYGYSCVAREISLLASQDAADQAIVWEGRYLAGKLAADVKALVIDSGTFEILPKNVKNSFANIETIIVKQVQLKTLKKINFDSLNTLKKLSITKNAITSIERNTFDPLIGLIHLDLSENQIATLPTKAFDKLMALKNLDLSTNALSSLDQELIPSANAIENFNAKGNDLTRIDIFFLIRLKTSKIIDFSENTGCTSKYGVDDRQTFTSFNQFFLQIVLGNC